MARTKLTAKLVSTQAPSERELLVWDTELPGFGLRVMPSGARAYVVQYTFRGRSRRMTLGKAERITLTQARRLARKAFGQVADGVDPMEAREKEREAKQGERMADLAKRYMAQHAERKKSPRSVLDDRQMLDRLEERFPKLWRKRVEDVTRADIGRLHYAMRATPVAANRAIALLSKVFRLAEGWGLRPDGSNPCRHVERYPERSRERFLSSAELAKLGESLASCDERPSVVTAVKLLILTGARRGEILGLKWSQVDFENRRLLIPQPKEKRPKTVPLNAPALQLLDGLEREGEYVLPGRLRGQPLANISKPWQRIRDSAGLPGLRLHDLRHTHAAIGAGSGLSLHLIGSLLGHRTAAMTQRYAHVSADARQEASEAIGSRIAAALEGDEAEVRRLRS